MSTRLNIIRMSLISLMLALLCTGCAFGTRHVTLMSIPTNEISNHDVPSNKVVYVLRPKDNRLEQSSVGCVRNGFRMRTAEVLADGDVPQWVQSIVGDALKKYGYIVSMLSETSESAQRESDVVVSLTLNKFFCDCPGKLVAEVEIQAELKQKDEILYKTNYSGQEEVFSLTGSSADYSKALHAAMSNCSGTMIPDLHRAVLNSTNAKAVSRFCPHCGVKCEELGSFCPACGGKVSQ